MHYFCLIRKGYHCVLFVNTQLIQGVTNELCCSQSNKQATQHIARFIAAPDAKVPLTLGRTSPPHTHSPATQGADRPLPPSTVFPSFFSFFFFSLRCGHFPPPPTPGNDWWSSHLMVYLSHTKHSNHMSSVSCSLAPAQKRLPHHSLH